MDADAPFPQLVFSGGGLRCFWQGGFQNVLRDRLVPNPERIASVSGGALGSAAWIAHKGHELRDTMCAKFDELDSNVDPHAPVDGQRGLSPHQQTYRDVAEEVLTDRAVQDIVNGPPLQILIGHPPSGALDAASGTLATFAYEAELHTVASPHFSWAEKLGVTSTLVDATRAAREGRLADLCWAAATIPPIFEPPEWDGRPVIDGGMADQAPMPEPDEGPTLVMLTREYSGLTPVAGRLYVWPSDDVPADKIDFTDPDKIRETWRAGERDAERYLAGEFITC